jgi:hypothetical protein
MIMHTHKHTHTHTKIHIHIHINTHPPYNASQRTLHQTLPAQGGHGRPGEDSSRCGDRAAGDAGAAAASDEVNKAEIPARR